MTQSGFVVGNQDVGPGALFSNGFQFDTITGTGVGPGSWWTDISDTSGPYNVGMGNMVQIILWPVLLAPSVAIPTSIAAIRVMTQYTSAPNRFIDVSPLPTASWARMEFTGEPSTRDGSKLLKGRWTCYEIPNPRNTIQNREYPLLAAQQPYPKPVIVEHALADLLSVFIQCVPYDQDALSVLRVGELLLTYAIGGAAARMP